MHYTARRKDNGVTAEERGMRQGQYCAYRLCLLLVHHLTGSIYASTAQVVVRCRPLSQDEVKSGHQSVVTALLPEQQIQVLLFTTCTEALYISTLYNL